MAPRIIPHWLFPAAAVVLWCLVTINQVCAAPGDKYLVRRTGSPTFYGGPYGSPSEAWAGAAAAQNAQYPTSPSLQWTTAAGCGNPGAGASGTLWGNNDIRIAASFGCFQNGYEQLYVSSCAAGQEAYWNGTSTSCRPGTCPEGQHLEGSSCVPDFQCGDRGTIASGWFDMGTTPEDPPGAVCANGCMAVFSGASVSRRALVGGTYHYYAEGQYDESAAECETGNALPGVSSGGVPADSCGSGQTMGQVNGRNLCVDNSTGAPTNPNATPGTTTTTTTQTPDTPPTEDNPADLSGDGVTVTQNADGSTTTKTVSTDPGTGVRTITETRTEPSPEGSYCAEHPNAPICKESEDEEEGESSWSGSCGAFACDGDAIQCAIAREQHQRNCTLFETATALSDLGNAAAGGTDEGTTNNPALETNREEIDLGTSLDQTRWLTGACPASVNTSILGQSFTLDFAPVCSVLEVIGLLGVAVTLVVAVRIVGVF